MTAIDPFETFPVLNKNDKARLEKAAIIPIPSDRLRV